MTELENSNGPWQSLLAEDMPLDVFMEIYAGRRRKIYSDTKRSTDFNLEMALLTRDPRYFELTQDLLSSMTRKPLSYGDKSLRTFYPVAKIFEAQLPVFEERKYDFDVPISAIRVAHKGMVNILNSRVHRRKPNRLRLPIYDSLRAELEMASLLSRVGKSALFPYFATSREECCHSDAQFNHDFYVIDKGGRKIPIQVKSSFTEHSKDYDPSVLVICRRELEGVVSDVDVQNGDISLLLGKEYLDSISYKERRRLKKMSEYVLGRIEDHYIYQG